MRCACCPDPVATVLDGTPLCADCARLAERARITVADRVAAIRAENQRVLRPWQERGARMRSNRSGNGTPGH